MMKSNNMPLIVLVIGQPVAVAEFQARLKDILPLGEVSYASFTGVDNCMAMSWLPPETLACYSPSLLRLLTNCRKAVLRCLPPASGADSDDNSFVQVVMSD